MGVLAHLRNDADFAGDVRATRRWGQGYGVGQLPGDVLSQFPCRRRHGDELVCCISAGGGDVMVRLR